jgi:hypothetical protein
MKRKVFIATAATVALAIPTAYYFYSKKKPKGSLIMPEMLGQFCSEAELKKIGTSYNQQVPKEASKDALTSLLLIDENGKKISNNNSDAVATALNKNIQQDFISNRTLVINGWVISQTEARQCALFSLTV